MIRAVVDVNVIVSAVLTPEGTPGQLLLAWQAAEFFFATSDSIIAEIEQKLRSPRIGGAYGVTSNDVQMVSTLLRIQAEVVTTASEIPVPVTGDPEDDHVLATGVAGRADYLVTGDRRLLELARHRELRIVSPREFLELLEQMT